MRVAPRIRVPSTNDRRKVTATMPLPSSPLVLPIPQPRTLLHSPQLRGRYVQCRLQEGGEPDPAHPHGPDTPLPAERIPDTAPKPCGPQLPETGGDILDMEGEEVAKGQETHPGPGTRVRTQLASQGYVVARPLGDLCQIWLLTLGPGTEQLPPPSGGATGRGGKVPHRGRRKPPGIDPLTPGVARHLGWNDGNTGHWVHSEGPNRPPPVHGRRRLRRNHPRLILRINHPSTWFHQRTPECRTT